MKTSTKIKSLTQLSLLISLLAVLAFTPLGLIMIPPVAVTLLHIPVIIGAISMGPMYGGILGGVFGLFAMYKATVMSVSPIDILFSPFLSNAPIQSIIMCLGTRILFGIVAGFIFAKLKKTKINPKLQIALTAGISTLIHTVLVLGCMSVFFNQFPLKEVLISIVGINSIMEIISAIVVSVLVVPAIKR